MTYLPERWILDDLLPPASTPDMKAMFASVQARVLAFEALRKQLAPDMAEDVFLDILQKYEQLYADASRLLAYAHLWFSEDVGEQQALGFRSRVQQFTADMQNRTLFFELWWKALPDADANRLLAHTGDLSYYLESLRLFKPHTLTEPEEKIINIKNVNGIHAVTTLYEMITNALKFTLTVDGEEKTLTRGQLSFYVTSPDPDLRAAAYQELYRVYAMQADVLAEVYAARVRDWQAENVTLRGFTSPISVRNLENDIPDAVVSTLLDVIRQNVGLFQRFFKFKARVLGVDRLRRYDLYAPLSEAEQTYTFNQAVRMVDAAYRAFSPTLADLALRVSSDHHLDSEIRPRKMDGAFCYSPVPTLTPWVQVNFQGKINDVSTLAHELGHAVHGMLAEAHSPLTFHPSLPMAETASVFGEMLLNDKLLNEEQDPAIRRTLISTLLDDAYATIIRQGYFVIFENEAHNLIVNGATPDDLYTAYLDNLREQFGDALNLSDDFRYEWLAIPHIYEWPFYCYAYAFGNLLVLALYRKYKELGKAFEADYLRILSYGGSASPHTIISEAGFDMADPGFWQGGFDVLAELLEELEEMA